MQITLPIPLLQTGKAPVVNGAQTVVEDYAKRTWDKEGGIVAQTGTAVFAGDAQIAQVGDFVNGAVGTPMDGLFQGHPSNALCTGVSVSTSQEQGLKIVRVECSSSNESETSGGGGDDEFRPTLVARQVTRALEQHRRYQQMWKKDVTINKSDFTSQGAEDEWNTYFGDSMDGKTIKMGMLIQTIKMGNPAINAVLKSSTVSSTDSKIVEYIEKYSSGQASYIEPQLECRLSVTIPRLNQQIQKQLPKVGIITTSGLPSYFSNMQKPEENWCCTDAQLVPHGKRGWKWEYTLTSGTWDPDIYKETAT